jgi:putative membrane protein
MKLRALAIIAAFAVPGLASAVPADVPPTSPPTSNAPNNNTPNNNPATPSPDQAPMRDQSPTNPGDKPSTDKLPSERDKTTDKATDKAGMKGEKLSDSEIKTIAHLHHVNQMEIQLGQLAEKSGSAHVKDYAKTLVSDHQSADKDLTAFAKAHKLMAIPADKAATDADRQDEKDMTTASAKLKTLKGAAFDKEYLNMMVSGHDKELTKIDVAISGASDADLKSLLQGVKPVLQRHADQARDLQKSPQASTNMPSDKVPTSK